MEHATLHINLTSVHPTNVWGDEEFDQRLEECISSVAWFDSLSTSRDARVWEVFVNCPKDSHVQRAAQRAKMLEALEAAGLKSLTKPAPEKGNFVIDEIGIVAKSAPKASVTVEKFLLGLKKATRAGALSTTDDAKRRKVLNDLAKQVAAKIKAGVDQTEALVSVLESAPLRSDRDSEQKLAFAREAYEASTKAQDKKRALLRIAEAEHAASLAAESNKSNK